MARRFFFDTEFIEEPNHLDLISIGFINAAGTDTFYAINKRCDLNRANPWVQEYVLPQLSPRSGGEWKCPEVIRQQLLDYLKPTKEDPVELWGYYSAYDHVLLCGLFGRMIDLPPGMPMYTCDIKQFCDRLGNPKLPEGTGHHNALGDARWAREAFHFLVEREKELETQGGASVGPAG